MGQTHPLIQGTPGASQGLNVPGSEDGRPHPSVAEFKNGTVKTLFHPNPPPSQICLNHLTPNDHYSGRITPLNSKRCILYIYSTNIGTEYFKHGIYSPFFFLFKMQVVS